VFILNDTPSVAHHFLAEIRDVQVQHDRLRFRRNMERLGELLAYELSKSLDYTAKAIQTPLDEITVPVLSQPPVLISILRAGIPFHQGFLNYFDQAENGFIGAYRKHEQQEAAFTIAMEYQALPFIDNRTVILIDPMLATGRSIVAAVQALRNHGNPGHLHIATAIAAPEGLAYLQQHLNTSYSLWIGALDEKLNDKFYIVPGLGDAGDLAFGPKL
jgi:uracil phosphoribosyltransferase